MSWLSECLAEIRDKNTMTLMTMMIMLMTMMMTTMRTMMNMLVMMGRGRFDFLVR